jgi:phage terminase Nu1 subunit (DNA packaging protein)
MAKSKLIAGQWIPDVCSKADLSLLLGISIRALGDLHAKGVLVPAAKRGTYQTIPSVNAYIDKIRAAASGRLDEQRNPLNDERLKDVRVNREISELKLAQLKGELLTLDEVTDSWTKFAAKVKAAALALPSKARTQIPHLTAHDGETLKTLIKDMLNDLADEVADSVVGGEAGDVKPD